MPKLSITLTVGIEGGSEPLLPVIRASSHDIACDFVDGWAFGDAIGVGVRSLQGWWAVTSVSVSRGLSEVSTLIYQDHSATLTPPRISNLSCSRKHA